LAQSAIIGKKKGEPPFKGGVFFFPKIPHFGPHCGLFHFSLEKPILNIFNREKNEVKAQIPYFSNFEKNIFFKRLHKSS